MFAYLSWGRSSGWDRTMDLCIWKQKEIKSMRKTTCSQTVVILHSFHRSLSTLPVAFSWWLGVILHWEILIANTCIRLAQARLRSKSFTCIESLMKWKRSGRNCLYYIMPNQQNTLPSHLGDLLSLALQEIKHSSFKIG